MNRIDPKTIDLPHHFAAFIDNFASINFCALRPHREWRSALDDRETAQDVRQAYLDSVPSVASY